MDAKNSPAVRNSLCDCSVSLDTRSSVGLQKGKQKHWIPVKFIQHLDVGHVAPQLRYDTIVSP